jgi:hypothetical protein
LKIIFVDIILPSGKNKKERNCLEILPLGGALLKGGRGVNA